MAFSSPSVSPGYVGICQFWFGGKKYQTRMSSCDVMLKQAVDKKNIIDIRYDRNVYTILPEEIGGSLSFPLVTDSADNQGFVASSSLISAIYNWATYRDFRGRMNFFDLGVKYSAFGFNSFVYTNSYINSFGLSVKERESVNLELNIVSKYREEQEIRPRTVKNSRVITWNDVFVEIRGGVSVDSEYFREFQFNIANNIERIYTASGKLSVQDLAPRQRDITGVLKVLGRHERLSRRARNNPYNCEEGSYINFGLKACGGDFSLQIPNTVFEIEEISMTNEIIETVVRWHSLPTNHVLSLLDDSGSLFF